MSLDLEIDVAVLALQPRRQFAEPGLGFRRQLVDVGRELHRIVGEHHLIEEPAFGQLVGGVGPVEGVFGGALRLLGLRLHLADMHVFGRHLTADETLGSAPAHRQSRKDRSAAERARLQDGSGQDRVPFSSVR